MQDPNEHVPDAVADAPPELQYQQPERLFRPLRLQDLPQAYALPCFQYICPQPLLPVDPSQQQIQIISLGQFPANTISIAGALLEPFPISSSTFVANVDADVNDENNGNFLVDGQMFPCSSHAYDHPPSTSQRYGNEGQFSSNTLTTRLVDIDSQASSSKNFFPKRGRPVTSVCRVSPTKLQSNTGRAFQPLLVLEPALNFNDALSLPNNFVLPAAPPVNMVLPAALPPANMMVGGNAENVQKEANRESPSPIKIVEPVVVGDYVNPFMSDVLNGENKIRFKMGAAINMTRYIFLLDSDGFCSRAVYAPFLNRNLYYLKDHGTLRKKCGDTTDTNDQESVPAAEVNNVESVKKPLLPVTVKFNFIRNNFCFGDRSAVVQCFYTSEIDCVYAPLKRIPSAMFDMKVNEKLRHISIDLPDSFMRRSSKDIRMRKEHFVVRVVFLFEGAEVGGGKRLRKVPSRLKQSEIGKSISPIPSSSKADVFEQYSSKEVVMFGAKQLVNYTVENGYNIVHGENSIVLFSSDDLKLSTIPYREWMAYPSAFIERIQRLLRKQFDNPFMSVQVLNCNDDDEDDDDEDEEESPSHSSSLPLVRNKAIDRIIASEVKTKTDVASTSSDGKTSGAIDCRQPSKSSSSQSSHHVKTGITTTSSVGRSTQSSSYHGKTGITTTSSVGRSTQSSSYHGKTDITATSSVGRSTQSSSHHVKTGITTTSSVGRSTQSSSYHGKTDITATSSVGRSAQSSHHDKTDITATSSVGRSDESNVNIIKQYPNCSTECFIEIPKDPQLDCISITSADINLIYMELPEKIAFRFIVEEDESIAKDSSAPKDVSFSSDERRDSSVSNQRSNPSSNLHAFKPTNPNVSASEVFMKLGYFDDENEELSQKTKSQPKKDLVRVFNTSYMCFFCFAKLQYPNLGALYFHLRCCHARFRFEYDPEISVSKSLKMQGFIVRLNNNFDGSGEISPIRHFIKLCEDQRNELAPRKCSPVADPIYIVPNKLYANYIRRSLVCGLKTEKPLDSYNTSLFRDSPMMDVRQGTRFCFEPPTKINHQWMMQTNDKRLSEITDLHQAERKMMKMWNDFVVNIRVTLLGRVMMYKALRVFIDLHREQLMTPEMRVQFLCKISNLTNYGYLDQNERYDLFMRLDPDYKPWEDTKHYIRQHLNAINREHMAGGGGSRGPKSRSNNSGGSSSSGTTAKNLRAGGEVSTSVATSLENVNTFLDLKKLYPFVPSKQLSKIWKYLRTYTLADFKTSQ